MLEDFRNHPAVAPIIRGAKVVEHSGHMVPEGGYDMIPKYIFDGCLLAGETAGLCMNMGYQVRGMDFDLYQDFGHGSSRNQAAIGIASGLGPVLSKKAAIASAGTL